MGVGSPALLLPGFAGSSRHSRTEHVARRVRAFPGRRGQPWFRRFCRGQGSLDFQPVAPPPPPQRMAPEMDRPAASGREEEGGLSSPINKVEGPGSQRNQAGPGLLLLFTLGWASVGGVMARNPGLMWPVSSWVPGSPGVPTAPFRGRAEHRDCVTCDAGNRIF